MLGDALKLSINSKSVSQDTAEFYFPPGLWCPVTQPTVATDSHCLNSTGELFELGTKLYDVGLHLREGYIVPLHDAASFEPMTTVDVANSRIDFAINPQKTDGLLFNYNATGLFINDDGETLDTAEGVNSY